MTHDEAPAPAGRRTTSRSGSTAALLAVLHGVVAATAVTGCLTLIRLPFDGANLPTLRVQASGIVALNWAYAGLLLGLLIGIRPPRSQSGRSGTQRSGRSGTRRPGRSGTQRPGRS